MTDTAIDLPIYNTPIIDARGNISEVWWRFFATLLARTGGSEGDDIDELRRLVDLIILQLRATANLESSMVSPPLPSQSQLFDLLMPVMQQARPQPDFGMVPTHGIQNDGALHEVVTVGANGFMSSTDKLKLDALLPTGAWSALPLSAGFTAGAIAPQYRLDGASTQLRGQVVSTSAIALLTLTSVATLPAAYRPAFNTNVIAIDTTSNYPVRINVVSGTGVVGVIAMINAIGAGDTLDLSAVQFSWT